MLTQSDLLTLTVSLFADPDGFAPGTFGSSIANAAGAFESIWDVADNSGFGITGFVRHSVIKLLPGELDSSRETARRSQAKETNNIDEAVCLFRTKLTSYADLLVDESHLWSVRA